MPRPSQHPKEESFNFWVDPKLKAAFQRATEAEDKPAAQVLRDSCGPMSSGSRSEFSPRRGDLVTVAVSGDYGKPRPA